ncbi:MFS transporter permease [Planosporangium sp. 12N6]|uniref:MFS transporter permease n=1 Tax=Planosporangium spinosum TaxID=3402278 RepID=UPI003CEE4E92
MTGWLTEPVPRARVAWLRTLVYLFIAADLVVFTPWVRHHGQVPGEFYRPLLLGRLLHLPTPTGPLVDTVYWLLLPAAVAAASGRAPRLLGWTVFALYTEWMVVAMSYGKVDHDRFALLVALAVLPTAGPARHRDTGYTERGGWALRMTQLAAVATYFLAAWAKLRFGGPGWVTGATLNWALLRRGTELGRALTGLPWLLVAAQFGIMAFELGSPLVFAVPRRRRAVVVTFFYAFHLAVFATVTISFIPQQVALASFLPLERLGRRRDRDSPVPRQPPTDRGTNQPDAAPVS